MHYLYDCTIEVPNLDAAMKAVKENGGMITREKMELPKVGWFASAKDTEGNRFGLMQPTDWQQK
jgi:predicted enzyme related to lactoylglutathione lyase